MNAFIVNKIPLPKKEERKGGQGKKKGDKGR